MLVKHLFENKEPMIIRLFKQLQAKGARIGFYHHSQDGRSRNLKMLDMRSEPMGPRPSSDTWFFYGMDDSLKIRADELDNWELAPHISLKNTFVMRKAKLDESDSQPFIVRMVLQRLEKGERVCFRYRSGEKFKTVWIDPDKPIYNYGQKPNTTTFCGIGPTGRLEVKPIDHDKADSFTLVPHERIRNAWVITRAALVKDGK